MAKRRIPSVEELVSPATMRLAVKSRLRRDVKRISAMLVGAVMEAIGPELPADARAFQDLETRLTAAAAAHVVAKVVRQVLEAVHREDAYVLACVDQARHAHGITPCRWENVSVRLRCGESVEVRTPYSTVVREKRPGPKRKRGQHGPAGRGCHTVLAQLGVVERASPALHSEAAWMSAAIGSYGEAAEALAHRGIVLHVNTIRLLAHRFADAAIADRLAAVPPIAGPGRLAGRKVVIAIDGGRIRTRVENPGRRRENGRHGYDTPWREPKLMAVYTVGSDGRKDGYFVFYEATLAPYDEAVALFVRWLARFGIGDADEVVFAADGSLHIWDRVPSAIEALGLDPSRVRSLVDFWHAAQHACEASKLLPKLTSYEAKLRASCWKEWLKKGRALDVSTEIAKHARSARGKAKTELENHAAYFADNAARMNYPSLRAAKLPIGTGVVESAVRRIVNLRLKGPGVFWDPENAERMLVLRSRLKAGRWRELEDIVHSRAGAPHGEVLRKQLDQLRDEQTAA